MELPHALPVLDHPLAAGGDALVDVCHLLVQLEERVDPLLERRIRRGHDGAREEDADLLDATSWATVDRPRSSVIRKPNVPASALGGGSVPGMRRSSTVAELLGREGAKSHR